MMPIRIAATVTTLAFLVGCAVASESSESSADALSETSLLASCPRRLASANRTRKVVVSHPFGDNPNRYDVLKLTSAGTLTHTNVAFELGRASSSVPIVFTPDGEIGLVPQDDGTIGVFRFAGSGQVDVVDAHWSANAGFWPRALTMDPKGTRVFAVSANTPENGGGVYEIAIGCDGRLVSRGLVVPGGPAHAFELMPSDTRRGVLYAGKAFESAPTSNTFLLDVSGSSPSIAAQGDGFGDMQSIASSIGITFDGKYALVGDDGLGAGNRVAVVSLPSMKSKQVLATRAPYSIATSPWNNAAIVVNGDSADEITGLRYDASNAETPFTITGAITSSLPRPMLPGVAVQITRGRLKGRVLVAELLAVRQLQFTSGGAIDDVSQLEWTKTMENVVGTVGVQP